MFTIRPTSLPSLPSLPLLTASKHPGSHSPRTRWVGLGLLCALALGGCAGLPGVSPRPGQGDADTATHTSSSAQRPPANHAAQAGAPRPAHGNAASTASTDTAPPPPAADLWGRIRQGFVLPPVEHPLVDSHMRRFADIDYFEKRAARIRLLLPVIVQAIEERGLPMELAMVPLVESALNCHAQSVVAATGCWQFMHGTAKDQKLVVSALVDQRRDLLKSTDAALDYLQSLHQQTQDWHLAMAAYNWGIGRVLRLRDAARARGEEASFATLAARMPEETRNYVPQIEALKRLIAQADPDDLPEVPNQALVQTVPLTRDIDLALAARLAGISPAELQRLNHAVQPPVILAAAVPELLLPLAAAERFEAAAAQHRGPWASWTVVRNSGHSGLSQLASLHGTSVQALRSLNNVGPGMKPAAGSVLLVPRDGNDPQRVDTALVASAQRHWVPELVRIAIKPRARETLAQLAQRMDVPLASLQRWNPGLSAQRPLKPAQRITLMVAPEEQAETLALSQRQSPAAATVVVKGGKGKPGGKANNGQRKTEATAVAMAQAKVRVAKGGKQGKAALAKAATAPVRAVARTQAGVRKAG